MKLGGSGEGDSSTNLEEFGVVSFCHMDLRICPNICENIEFFRSSDFRNTNIIASNIFLF